MMVKLQIFRREFKTLNMKGGEIIQIYLCKVSSLFNEIRSCCEDTFERKVVEKILRCLPRFNYFVVAIDESKNLSSSIIC